VYLKNFNMENEFDNPSTYWDDPMNPVSVNQQTLSLSPHEVEKIISLFLDSRHIQKAYCPLCHLWECTTQSSEGSVHFTVTIFPTEDPKKVIVEFQRISGSSLVFGSIFRDFKWNREHSEESGSDLPKIREPPVLPIMESQKAIEALRCWLDLDPLEAATAIGSIDDSEVGYLPAFKLLKMEAIQERAELEKDLTQMMADHVHHHRNLT
jgi:hypothetical protein